MTTDDLAWVQSRLRNCTNARRQLRICAECLSVAEDTLLERLGYTSLDTCTTSLNESLTGWPRPVLTMPKQPSNTGIGGVRMAKSILQKDKECYLCRRFYNLRTTRGLEEHHILFGRGRRELSERYGLKVWLCHNHHNEPHMGVHFDPAARRVLEQAAQFAFDELHGPGSFAEVFGEEI